MLHISVEVINRINTAVSSIFIYLMFSLLPKDLITIQNLSLSTAADAVPYDGCKMILRTSS